MIIETGKKPIQNQSVNRHQMPRFQLTLAGTSQSGDGLVFACFCCGLLFVDRVVIFA